MVVFFDLDGTLTDPKEGIVACIRFALLELGVEIDDRVPLESCIGPPLRESFLALCQDERLVEKAVALYRQRFSSVGLYENYLYDGIEDCLRRLKLRRLKHKATSIYVVTSKPTMYAEQIVKHFNLQGYFQRVYGSNLDGTLCNKTELLEYVLKSEKIDLSELTSEAMMVGDRKFDVVGAKNNKMRAIGVLWGYGTEQELRDAGADEICRHPSQLYECLTGYLMDS